MAEIIIRPATIADAPAVGELWAQLVAFHLELDESMPRPARRGAQLYARRIASQVDDPQTCTLVAVVDDRIVGYVMGMLVDLLPDVFEQEMGGFLADIYVQPEYRGQGVGRELVHGLEGWFRQQGLRQYEWYVAARNTAGRAFWQAVGGREVMIRMQNTLVQADGGTGKERIHDGADLSD